MSAISRFDIGACQMVPIEMNPSRGEECSHTCTTQYADNGRKTEVLLQGEIREILRTLNVLQVTGGYESGHFEDRAIRG
ncbi:MAG: hypothetical protein ACOYKZ_02105 [Chlamydiia bacterium]